MHRRLPANTMTDAKLAPLSEFSPFIGEEAITPSAEALTKQSAEKHILIVDDDPMILMLVSKMVLKLGYRPKTAADGMDGALKSGCRRVYISGAAVTHIHHTMRSKVWAVPNADSLIGEIKGYPNTLLMSEIEGTSGQGNIAGLNGLLLGVAKEQGIEAICLMGEIPIYLQGLPFPYPKASKSVMEALAAALGLEVDLTSLDTFPIRTQ